METNIEKIKIQFLRGLSVDKIDFGEIFKFISWTDQENLLNQTILNESNRKYPLKKSYQITFLKHVIRQLELNGCEEIFDGFYENLATLLEVDEEEFSYKHFKIPGSESFVSLKEANSFIRDGTTGLRLWPAAIKLSEFIAKNKEYFNNKSVLELGSGASGYVGLTLLKSINASKIFLSDCHEVVIRNLTENIKLNIQEATPLETSLLIRHRIKANEKELAILSLPWEEIDEHIKELNSILSPQVILAADVVYDDTIFQPLIHCLNALFDNNNGNNTLEFILSQTIRNEDTFHKFCELLKENSFSATEMMLDNNNEAFPRDTNSMDEEIRVLKIMRLCE